jgi:hypothetical protein
MILRDVYYRKRQHGLPSNLHISAKEIKAGYVHEFKIYCTAEQHRELMLWLRKDLKKGYRCLEDVPYEHQTIVMTTPSANLFKLTYSLEQR